MTRKEAIIMLNARIKCIEHRTSGMDMDCNSGNCNDCDLCYLQGNRGEQQEALKMAIEALKQPEIVYCKDCKYYRNNTEYCQKHNKWHCMRDNTVKSQNHYCSRAERKDDI